jgi:hypothetical protein
LTLRVMVLDRNVPPLDVAGFAKPLRNPAAVSAEVSAEPPLTGEPSAIEVVWKWHCTCMHKCVGARDVSSWPISEATAGGRGGRLLGYCGPTDTHSCN